MRAGRATRRFGWSALRLRTKGLIVVALPILPLALLWLLIGAAMIRGSEPTNTAGRTREIRAGLTDMFLAVVDAEAGVRAYLTSGDLEALRRYERAAAQVPRLLDGVDPLIIDAQLRTAFDGLRRLVLDQAAALRALAAGQPGPVPAEAAAALARLRTTAEEVRTAIAAIDTRQRQLSAERTALAQRRSAILVVMFLGASVLCTAGGVAAALVLANGIRRRIDTLADNADRLAAGTAVDDVDIGEDEIGQLGRRLAAASRLLRQREADRAEALAQLDGLNATLRAQTAQVESANKELEAFSYSVSHDLRAPLRAIDGFSQVIEEDQADRLDASGRDALKRVRAAATRMGTLIDELLNLARITRHELQRGPVDVSAMASGILVELERQEPRRAVQVAIAPDLTAEADPRMLSVALQNLLHNAWKYTGKTPAPRIELGASQNGGVRIYHVRDNGAGFDMTYAAKLFGAFQRLHADRDFEGTGIGLATVQRIIHRHGGRIWADSSVGAGATFYFTLESGAADAG